MHNNVVPVDYGKKYAQAVNRRMFILRCWTTVYIVQCLF